MDLFSVKPIVSRFERFREFAEAFSLSADDLILTETILFDAYIKPLSLPCRVVLKDRYDPGEPDDATLDRILADTETDRITRIFAVGGGSVIDIGKMMMIRNARPFADVVSGKTPIETDKTLVVVPTTCGTGSEVTNGGIVTMKSTGLKTGIMSERLTATHAVLIPELLEGLPYKVFFFSSVDALSHCMESFVSPTRGNEFARAAAARGIELILAGYVELLRHGQDARAPGPRTPLLGDFLTASCLGGMAVNNGGAGPVHALAYPLGERYKVSHGESVYLFLGAVFRMYRQARHDGALLERLATIIKPAISRAGFPAGDDDVFVRLDEMLGAVHPLRSLRECGMTESEIESFADTIIATKQRLIVASYVPFTIDHARAIYRSRF